MKYIISESLPIPATVVQDTVPSVPAPECIVNVVPLGIKPFCPDETVHVPLYVTPDIK